MHGEILEMQEEIRRFNRERDWDKYHTPKNLAASLVIEASELLENLQWDDPSYDEIRCDSERMSALVDEVADIWIYLLNISDRLGVDVRELIKNKVEKNEARYPVELAKGSSKKYTELK